jgi:hypothetical protein
MTTINSPATQAQTVGDWGYSAAFLQGVLLQELTDRLNVLSSGLIVPLEGVSGSGSNTVRRRQVGGLGFAARMASMATETAPGSSSGFTSTYSDVTIGRYHLAYEESAQRAIVQADGVDLDFIAAGLVNSWFATLRYLMCTSATSISTAKGNTGAALDTTGWFGLIAAFNETAGFEGEAIAVLQPEQITDLQTSLRSYTGFQFPDQTEAQQALGSALGMGMGGRLLGINVYKTTDVQQSGGDHVGFAYAPGAFGFAPGDTSRVPVPDAAQPVRVPEFGLLVNKTFTGATATNRVDANAWLGVGRVNAAVLPQFRVLSIDN